MPTVKTNIHNENLLYKNSLDKNLEYLNLTKNSVLIAEVVSYITPNKVSINLKGEYAELGTLSNVRVMLPSCQNVRIEVQLKPGDLGLYLVSNQSFATETVVESGNITNGFFIPTNFQDPTATPNVIVRIRQDEVLFVIGNQTWGVVDFLDYFNEKVVGTPAGPLATAGINKELFKLFTSLATATPPLASPYEPDYIPKYDYPSAFSALTNLQQENENKENS